MNEVKGTNKPEAAKKVGADGLTKKERRALKVQQTHDSNPAVTAKNENNIQRKNKTVCNNNKVNDTAKSDAIIGPNVEREVKTKAELKAERAAQFQAEKASKIETQKEEKLKENSTMQKSKAELKAARRQLQEKQREAKTVSTNVKQQTNAQIKPAVNIQIMSTTVVQAKVTAPTIDIKKLESKKADPINKHQVQLFNHLYFKSIKCVDTDRNLRDCNIHPAFIKLGARYYHKTIMGSNARCLALLTALDVLVKDYEAPKHQEFCRSLESSLQNAINYLQSCRPLAVSMMNALRHFKLNLTQIDTNLSDNQKKARLTDVIEIYLHDEIEKAGEAISLRVQHKITNGDIILTYGCSSLIKKILCDAHNEGKIFEVIVVDGRPLLEGREMLRCLSNLGIKCTYVLINALSFVMSKTTKIMLGAHALLANGFVMSRTGTAQIALIAQAYNKPVLVCCETYKFCERVQTDSFVYNEIGDPDQLVLLNPMESILSNWKDVYNLTPLNLLYDVTPPDLVTAVVTELGFLPCTSVPVVLRIKPTELN